jgi:HPt (histidine-containing phosphotransfer) domain-containing protein
MNPVVDPAVLTALQQEAGAERAREVVARYLAMLEERVYMLRGAVAAYNSAGALTTLRGLGEASAVVGAHQLAHLADSLESSLRRGNFRPARDAMPELLQLVAATKAALTLVLDPSTVTTAP